MLRLFRDANVPPEMITVASGGTVVLPRQLVLSSPCNPLEGCQPLECSFAQSMPGSSGSSLAHTVDGSLASVSRSYLFHQLLRALGGRVAIFCLQVGPWLFPGPYRTLALWKSRLLVFLGRRQPGRKQRPSSLSNVSKFFHNCVSVTNICLVLQNWAPCIRSESQDAAGYDHFVGTVYIFTLRYRHLCMDSLTPACCWTWCCDSVWANATSWSP